MVRPGDRLPFCAGVDARNQFYSLDAQAGRPAILVLGTALQPGAADPLLDALAPHAEALAALQADLKLLLGFAPAQDPAAIPHRATDPVILCPDHTLLACGAQPGVPLAIVIDRGARIMAAWPFRGGDPAAIAAAALLALRRAGREAAADCILPAPVLAMPGLLDPALCRDLIEGFEAGTTFDSGISTLGAGGQPVDGPNPAKKRRRDWLLAPGDALHADVLGLLFRRCVPEIKRAFQCDIAFADRILVARYDETGGYFHRHRDNLGPAVAFRQFALSVNLNAGFVGGHLLFPEFNDHRYCPAPGDGLAFSASLLHAAAPVTRGRRYVLLTFLHDAAAEVLRLAARTQAKPVP